MVERLYLWQVEIRDKLIQPPDCYSVSFDLDQLATLSVSHWAWLESVLTSNPIRSVLILAQSLASTGLVLDEVIDKLALLQTNVNINRPVGFCSFQVVFEAEWRYLKSSNFSWRSLKLFTMEELLLSLELVEEFLDCLRELLPKSRINTVIITGAKSERHWRLLTEHIGHLIPQISELEVLRFGQGCCLFQSSFEFIDSSLSNPSLLEIAFSCFDASFDLDLKVSDDGKIGTAFQKIQTRKDLKLSFSDYNDFWTLETLLPKFERLLKAFLMQFEIDALAFEERSPFSKYKGKFLEQNFRKLSSFRAGLSRRTYDFDVSKLQNLIKLDIATNSCYADVLENGIAICQKLRFLRLKILFDNCESDTVIYARLLLKALQCPLESFTVHTFRGVPQRMSSIWTREVIESIRKCKNLVYLDLKGLDRCSLQELLKHLEITDSIVEQCVFEAPKRVGCTNDLDELLLDFVRTNHSVTSFSTKRFLFSVKRSRFWRALDSNKSLCWWSNEMHSINNAPVLSILQRNRRELYHKIRFNLILVLRDLCISKPSTSKLFDANCISLISRFLDLSLVLEKYNKF